MPNLGPSPFVWLEFDENGTLAAESTAAFSALIANPNIDALIVMSHGWKNDKADATNLYGTLWAHTCEHLSADKAAKTAIAGVLWPAKEYQTSFDQTALADATGNNSLSAGDEVERPDLTESQFKTEVAAFEAFFQAAEEQSDPQDPRKLQVEAAAAAAHSASTGITNDTAKELVNEGCKTVGLSEESLTDTELKLDGAAILQAATDSDRAQALVSSLVKAPQFNVTEDVGAAQGLGETVSGLIDGPRAAVARFLNQLTYFEMKKRAGIVGESLAKNVLGKATPRNTLKLHLVGHSFGARLVTAAANVLAAPPSLPFFSLTLLQGAFSHNALAREVRPRLPGAFNGAVGKPQGPFVITHTHNDLACTLAYALASRISRDIAASIGDADDIYGAMGANGPQKLKPGESQTDDKNQTFSPVCKKINPVLADKFILKTADSDAHNNVTNKECGRLLAATLKACG